MHLKDTKYCPNNDSSQIMNLKEEVDTALNLVKEERQNDQESKMDS